MAGKSSRTFAASCDMPGWPDCKRTSTFIDCRGRAACEGTGNRARDRRPGGARASGGRRRPPRLPEICRTRRTTAGRGLHAQAEHAVAQFRGRQLELHGHGLAVAEQDLFGRVDEPSLAAAGRILGGGAFAGQKLHAHRLSLHAVALDRTFHREAIAGKDPGGNVEIGHADVDGLLFRPHADGVDGDVRLAGEFLRGVGRCAGVQAAVAHQHDPGNGRVPLLLQELFQGLAQAGIGAAGHEMFAPNGRRHRPACETSAALCRMRPLCGTRDSPPVSNLQPLIA